MVFPLWFVSRCWNGTPLAGSIGFEPYWFWAVLSNAAARGKRQRIRPASLTEKAGLKAGLAGLKTA
jgi:hypothetical protein